MLEDNNMIHTKENKKEAVWKKILSKTLKELGFIDEKLIGRIVIQGKEIKI